MQCAQCGTDNNPNGRFCSACGSPLPGTQPGAAEAQPQPLATPANPNPPAPPQATYPAQAVQAPYTAHPAPQGTQPYPPQPGYPPGAYAGPSDDFTQSLIPTKNPNALASYYMGLFSLVPCFCFLGIPAIILGKKGIAFSKTYPQIRGSGHGWAGIILGALGTLELLGIIAAIISIAMQRS